jgi:hypothetical protein
MRLTQALRRRLGGLGEFGLGVLGELRHGLVAPVLADVGGGCGLDARDPDRRIGRAEQVAEPAPGFS